jgi:class 3 adenylate cyclase
VALTETATFLFTDLVGSTAVASMLEPDAADELRTTHFGLLRGAIEPAGGQEIKNLGDGLMVRFTSPTRAVACAVAMQQAVERHNRRAEVELAVRMGLAAGEATEEDGDYFGEPVITASRLCATAGGGQILATDLVRLLVGRHGAQDFVAVGDLELKGLPDPVASVEVRWEPDRAGGDDAAVPLPGRLTVPGPVGFVGRVTERDALHNAWKAAVTGERRVVLVAGEAGIGKTRLVTEAALTAHEEGAVVLYGGCDEEVGVAYRPWREALGHLVLHAGPSLVDGVGPRRLADLARVLPEVREHIGDVPDAVVSDAETERYLFYSAVVALVTAASDASPVMVVIDDLQWLDRPSALLLRHVIGTPECGHLLIVGTYRDADVGGDEPVADLLAALHRQVGVERIALAGLDDAELSRFINTAAGEQLGEPGAEFARALYQETDGNPFFAWEVMRHLAETGVVGQDDTGGWVRRVDEGELRLPDSVREVVGRRVARLGGEVQRSLGVAAVAGATFDLDLLAAALGRDEEGVIDDLEAAERAGLVRCVGSDRFAFTHRLIQHTLYGDLSPARRARIHRRVAEALEQADPDATRAGELARHWAAAVTPADVDRAVRAAKRAGDQAEAALAPDEAIRWYRQALELLDHAVAMDPLRCELLCDLAEAFAQAGEPQHRETALDAAALARRIGDTDQLVRAALVGYRPGAGASDPDRQEVLEAALRAIGPDDHPDRARLLGALAMFFVFTDLERSVGLASEAIAVAHRAGDPYALVDALTGWPESWFLGGRENPAPTEESLRLAEELGDPARLFQAAWNQHMASKIRADRERAQRSLDRCAVLAEQTGRPDQRWQALYFEADWAVISGDLPSAEALATAAWELGEAIGQSGALSIYAAQIQVIRWQQGRSAEAQGLLARAAAQNPNVSVIGMSFGPDIDLRRAVDELPVDSAWLSTVTILAELAARRADPVCAELTSLLARYRGVFVAQGPLARGPAAHYTAILAAAQGDAETAAADFAQAAGINARLGAPFYAARTDIEWARLLLNQGDRMTAADLLHRAHATAERHGYAQLERRSGALLAQAAPS